MKIIVFLTLATLATFVCASEPTLEEYRLSNPRIRYHKNFKMVPEDFPGDNYYYIDLNSPDAKEEEEKEEKDHKP